MRQWGSWLGVLGAVMAGLMMAGCGEAQGEEAAPGTQPPVAAAPEAPGEAEQGLSSPLHPVWTRTTQGVDVRAHDVETDGAGNVVITFNYRGGPVSVSGRQLFWNGNADSIHLGVARYNRFGTLLWARGFAPAGGGFARVTGLGVSSLGNVFLVGRFLGTVNFGGADLTAGAGERNFVVKLSPGGLHRWSRATNPPPGTDFEFVDVEVKPTGSAVALATQRVSSSPLRRLMLIGYSGTSGAPQWDRSYSNLGVAERDIDPRRLALDGVGNAYVVGVSEDVGFVAAFSSLGFTRWSKLVAVGLVPRDVVAGGGRVVVSARSREGFTFLGGGRGPGSYVFAYTSLGTERWVRAVGQNFGAPFLGTTPLRSEVLVFGAGSADALGAPRFPSGADTWHVALLSRFSGLPLRLSRFPAPPGGVNDTELQAGAALSPAGHAYCTGNLDGGGDFGLGPIGPEKDTYLLRLSR